MDDKTKDALIAYLKEAWEKNYHKRKDRPVEIGEWFYGLAPEAGSPELRDMRKVYYEAYMDGAVDILDAVVQFDGDLRGMEAILALSHSITKGEA